MKTKLRMALRSNVDPFFFAFACIMLICVSLTAKALADDVLTLVNDSTDDPLLTADGHLLWAE